MKLATFNIYWLGDAEKAPRGDVELDAVAAILSEIDADVWVIQEVVDVEVLRDVLRRVPGRPYRFEDDDGVVVGGSGAPQRVVHVWDPTRVRVVAWSEIVGAPGRRPVWVQLVHLASGSAWRVVGVHFKAGYPEFRDAEAAHLRREQAQVVADAVAPWRDEATVVLGDFNALRSSSDPLLSGVVASLAPIRSMGWAWEDPLEDACGGQAVSSWTHQLLIDHVVLSAAAAARVVVPPTIVAFDLRIWPVSDLRLISDHRPVVVELRDV